MELHANIVIILVLVLGIMLAAFSFKLSDQTVTCTDQTVRRAVNGCLVLSTILVAASITFMLCGCGSGTTLKISSILGLFFALGITIITLSSIVHDKAGNSGCMAARDTTPILITISTIMSVGCLAYFGFKMYNTYKKNNAYTFG